MKLYSETRVEIFHYILSLISCWTENLFAEQRPDHASIPYTLRQMKLDWDHAHLVMDDSQPNASVSGSVTVGANRQPTTAPTTMTPNSSDPTT